MRKLLILIISIAIMFGLSCKKSSEESTEAIKEEVKVEKGFADVNGTRLYYEVAGLGDPIVLIHGNVGDRRHWDDQFEDFSKSHKVIRYDVRGFGKSSLPVEGERYSRHDDLKALLEHLGISKAHICGLSMGCAIAVDFVLTYPEMSSSLIAVGPWASGYDSPAAGELWEVFRKIPSIVEESGTKAAVDYFFDSPPFKKTIINPQVTERLKEIGYDYSFWHLLNQDPRFILDPPAPQQLDKISLPTLIITAEFDLEPCLEIADLLEATNPNARKVVIVDAGHVMNMEKPAEFNKAVLDFLKKLQRKWL